MDGPADDPRLFTRMSVKGLTAEQLYDSLALATGFATRTATAPNAFVNPFGGGGTRAEFLAKFSNVADKRTETQTSILQALSLMNGRITADATQPRQRSKALAGVIDSPVHGRRGRSSTRCTCAPSAGRCAPTRRSAWSPTSRRAAPAAIERKALADVFWVLLNSSEFIFNH